MFTTASGTKRSFYSQTGDFQFNTNIIIDSVKGVLDLGVSGNNGIKINFKCVSGKILDNNSNFVGVYAANKPFSISGNISSTKYDYFINSIPVAYGITKNAGLFNCWYIKPTGGININYDWFIKGVPPSLSISPINTYSGYGRATGYISNNNSLPLTIWSGRYINFSPNTPFEFDLLPTGILNGSSSLPYYIFPSQSGSVGQYTGNIELITNAGAINLETHINITPLAPEFSYSFNLNGYSYLFPGVVRRYISYVEFFSGDGIPMVASLQHVSGSGNYYTNITVRTGFTGITTTGFIYNTGYLTTGVTGIGTGQGGAFNLTGSGFTSGNIYSFAYSTGQFTWPYTVLMTGYGTGENYSGLGTGAFFATVTGFINTGVAPAGSGTYIYNNQFTGFVGNIYTISGTGNDLGTGNLLYLSPFVSAAPFVTTGHINAIFSGSGLYTGVGSGYITGIGGILDYTKTFTGMWNLFTGISNVDFHAGGFYNAGQNTYSRNDVPVYLRDSVLWLKVDYTNSFDSFQDVALLTVSGLNYESGLQMLITGNYQF